MGALRQGGGRGTEGRKEAAASYAQWPLESEGHVPPCDCHAHTGSMLVDAEGQRPWDMVCMQGYNSAVLKPSCAAARV